MKPTTVLSRFLIKQAVQVLYATLKREDDGTKRDKNHITVRCERCQSIHTFIIRENVGHRNIKFITVSIVVLLGMFIGDQAHYIQR